MIFSHGRMAVMITNNQIGYILIEENNGIYRGVALVTDFRGIPLDFRYTDPIKPTRIEQILYGGALDVYLKEELILSNLLDSIEVKPGVWICRNDSLLVPLRKLSKIPTLTLSVTSRPFLEQTGDVEPQPENGVFILQADAMGSPLRLRLSEEYSSEIDSVASFLVEVAKTMELSEPFSRIEKALKVIDDEQTN